MITLPEFPAGAIIYLHINDRRANFNLSSQDKSGIRYLVFDCGFNEVSIFLTTEQAKELANTILKQLENEKKEAVAV